MTRTQSIKCPKCGFRYEVKLFNHGRPYTVKLDSEDRCRRIAKQIAIERDTERQAA